MSQPVKQYSLIVLVIVLSLVALALVICGPTSVNGQVSADASVGTREEFRPDTVFIGDQACGECHKKYFASYSQSGMAMAMEPVAGSKVLSENPQLTMRVGPYYL